MLDWSHNIMKIPFLLFELGIHSLETLPRICSKEDKAMLGHHITPDVIKIRVTSTG